MRGTSVLMTVGVLGVGYVATFAPACGGVPEEQPAPSAPAANDTHPGGAFERVFATSTLIFGTPAFTPLPSTTTTKTTTTETSDETSTMTTTTITESTTSDTTETVTETETTPCTSTTTTTTTTCTTTATSPDMRMD